jgi:hypothetical protein
MKTLYRKNVELLRISPKINRSSVYYPRDVVIKALEKVDNLVVTFPLNNTNTFAPINLEDIAGVAENIKINEFNTTCDIHSIDTFYGQLLRNSSTDSVNFSLRTLNNVMGSGEDVIASKLAIHSVIGEVAPVCPNCNRGYLQLFFEDVDITYKEEIFSVPTEFYKCSTCLEEMIFPEQTKRNDAHIEKIWRRVDENRNL